VPCVICTVTPANSDSFVSTIALPLVSRHTVEAIRQLGWNEVAGLVVDVTGGFVVAGGADVVVWAGSVVVATGVVGGVVETTFVVGVVTTIVGITPASIVRFVSPVAKTNCAVRPVISFASESPVGLPPSSAAVKT
jgi:hypothetical protein